MRLSWTWFVGAVVALTAGLAVYATPASAVPITVTPSTTAAAIGTPFTVAAVYTDDGGATSASLSLSNPGVAVFSSASLTSGGNGETVGVTTAAISVSEDADAVSTSKTLTANVSCITAGTVTFSLAQPGVAAAAVTSAAVTCGATTGTGTATITVTPSLAPVGGQAVVTATYTGTTNTQMSLAANGFGTFGIPQLSPNTGDVFVGQGTQSLTWNNLGGGTKQLQVLFTCTSSGSAGFQLTAASQVVATTLNALVCGTGVGTPTVAVGNAQVSVAASPTSVNCSGTAFVTITVRNQAGGFVPDGTSVSLTTNIGSLSPSTATTLGGGVLAVYTAPNNNGGQASITANSGGATGTGTITVNCASATPAPAVPPTLPPAQTAPPPTTSTLPATIINPPNTGDAGLASSSDTRPYMGLVFAGSVILVAGGLMRARS
jgi:hypothetical protein